jgi:hypothetical protein
MKHSVLLTKRPLRTPSRWLSGILVSLILGTELVSAADALGPAATFPGQIALQNGKLTARLTATPLRQVMEEVSRVSKARVRWLGGQAEERPVSAEFTAVPLPEALRRILGETDFLLFYTSVREGAKLTQIWISPKTRPHPPSDSAAQNEDSMAEQAEPGPTPVATLIQVAVGAERPSLRIEAIARLGAYAQADPKVEGILSHLASNDGNPQVRAAAAEVLAGIDRNEKQERE